MRRWFAFATVLLLAAPAWADWQDQWLAFVYPNKDDLTTHEMYGPYDSLEKCRDISLAVIYDRSLQEHADYECGLNCEPWGSDGGFPMRCETTSR